MPARFARARALAQAVRDGSAREADIRELVALLLDGDDAVLVMPRGGFEGAGPVCGSR